MDLRKLKNQKPSEDRPLQSENLLSQEAPKPEPVHVQKTSSKKVGRPSTKQEGVSYKKVWYDLPDDLVKAATKFKVLNDFATNSELVETALKEYMKDFLKTLKDYKG